ncbi:hypothetical protein CCMSSC00406_0001807 [Pleurotus cornucopiae]|uniref:Uncharacterized protein n=1 Tax=Pleurotus cornucopiae TaxID=5321 RepID=A0ACB7J390_PLECO|nr:hypothetical protein CCMSSC00406_0001807 [Pleurotus cornucopiae]
MVWASTIFSIYATLLPTTLVACASAATFTVFDVRPTGEPSQFISLSALGVGVDGATTYDYFEVATAQVLSDATTTQTVAMPAVTLHATLVADATKNFNSLSPQTSLPFGVTSNCTWDESGQGVCIAEAFAPGLASTQTTTVTGLVVPIYTLTVDGGSSNTKLLESAGTTTRPDQTTITPPSTTPSREANTTIGRRTMLALHTGTICGIVISAFAQYLL